MAYVKIRPRRGTASQWEYANPILSEGEMAFEVPATGVGTGLINIKQGDGQNSWNNLPYAFNGGNLNQKVDDLAATVASYDSTISTLTAKVNAMEISVKNIRKIEIQASDPVQEDLILGEIWINTDMVTGTLFICDETGSQITDLEMGVGSTYNIKLANTITAATIIEWVTPDENVCSIKNKTNTGCTLQANTETSGITISALAKSDPTTVLMNAKLRVTIVVNGGIEIVPSDCKLIVGQGKTLGLTKTLTNYDTIQWSSSATYYVGIEQYSDNNAIIRAIKPGNSQIIARALLNGFTVASDNCIVTVGGISFVGDKTAVNEQMGAVVLLQLVFTNMIQGEDYDAIRWSSDTESIAYIMYSDNVSARVACQGAGISYVRCRATKNGELVQEITCLFTIAGRMWIDPDSFEKQIGQSGQELELHNELEPGTWDTIVWDTSNEEVLQISGSTNTVCTVRPKGAGTAVITASAYLGGVATGSTAASIGTVTGEMYIKYDDTECQALTLELGTAMESVVLYAFEDGLDAIKAWQWLSGDPGIVKIVQGSEQDHCTIQGLQEGQTTITLLGLTSTGGTEVDRAECLVTVERN